MKRRRPVKSPVKKAARRPLPRKPAKAAKPRKPPGHASAAEARLERTLYELEVHQEELRMQNLQLVQSQHLLEESRDRYADLYDFAPVAYVTLCDHGVVRELNLAAAALLREERGRLLETPFVLHVEPAYRRAFLDHIQRCRSATPDDPAVVTELVAHRKSGESVPVELSSVPSGQLDFRRYRTVVIDLTEHKRAEAERQRLTQTQRNEQLLRAILAALPVGVRVVDGGGKTLLFNEAACRIWGGAHGSNGEAPADDPSRVPDWRHLRARPADGDRVLRPSEWPAARALATGEPALDAVLHVRSPGAPAKTVRESAVPLLEEGGAIGGAVVLTEDITGLKQAETELRVAKDAAEEASRLKDEFLATVSHELRTPLSAILLWSQLLRTHVNDPAQRNEALDAIHSNAKAQSQLINDLLDVSRVVSGKVRVELQPQPLGPVIRDAIESVRPAADAKGVRIALELASPPAVAGLDATRFQQVLWNLLNNAVKFTARGGTVRVRTEIAGESARLTVSDTGQGIPLDFLPHLFDRFRQADATLTRAHGGLGLGLSIARDLVHLHGGTIRAQSPGPGKGATFIVELPLADPQGAAVDPAGAAAPTHHPARVLAGLRILVVEDEPDTRAAIARVLQQSGAAVTAVPSAAAARDALRRGPRPDVLLSDIAMPGEDGYSLLRAIRPDIPTTPAVALTAHARDDDRARALAASFQAHIPKPVEPDQLVFVIRSLVRTPAEPERSAPGTQPAGDRIVTPVVTSTT